MGWEVRHGAFQRVQNSIQLSEGSAENRLSVDRAPGKQKAGTHQRRIAERQGRKRRQGKQQRKIVAVVNGTTQWVQSNVLVWLMMN